MDDILTFRSYSEAHLMQHVLVAKRMILCDALGRGWMLGQHDGGTNRALDEFAATIGAFPAGQPCVYAVSAKCALVRTNARIKRFSWQVLVAAFAVRFEFEHWFFSFLRRHTLAG